MALSMGIGPADTDDDEAISTINTTPLVDVMLVLLIIFLITIPVVTRTVPVELPKERNLPTQTKAENIVLAVDKDGKVYWNDRQVSDMSELVERLKQVAVQEIQPEVHIRGDLHTRYENVGKVVVALQRAGIVKIGFITEPPSRNGS